MLIPKLKELQKHLKVHYDKVSVDNLVFKMHYRASFLILCLFTIILASREYIGEHIRCIVDKGIPQDVIDRFCFFTSTFTVVRHFNETMLHLGYLPHPGVGPHSNQDPVKHHAYYQWVPFMLFGQAIMFYIPHYIWRKVEGGRIQALARGLQRMYPAFTDEDQTINGVVIQSRGTVDNRVERIRIDFLTRLHISRPWSICLISCEVLNFFNIIFQIWITNLFLGGEFIGLGRSIMRGEWTENMDPLDLIFPKVTKCFFHKYGPSGSIQTHDALCVMALNVINEKIYTFLWFWFLIVFICSLLALVWRAACFFLHSRSAGFSERVFSLVNPGKLDLKNIISVTKECYFSDWIFLYYLSKNMDGFLFEKLFLDLARELDKSVPVDNNPIHSDEKIPILDDVDGLIVFDDATLEMRPPSPAMETPSILIDDPKYKHE